jgi:hypothetical protein
MVVAEPNLGMRRFWPVCVGDIDIEGLGCGDGLRSPALRARSEAVNPLGAVASISDARSDPHS